ncbi:MAG: InlB B-repeat-containing protein, partial [Acholeplasmataceae bacterium]|nr:InlB B-repeat-containing protein [Acholeplasmataceae bacterium]
MFKKIIVSVVLLTSVLLLVACGTTSYTVTFDSQGGTSVDAIVVEKGLAIEEPTDPTRESSDLESAWSFTGWYTSASAEASTLFDFASVIEADTTLYAGWTQNIVVRFNTKTTATVVPAYLPVGGGSVTEPTAPTRTGYTFGGWFFGKPGSTWLEPNAVEFPLAVTEATQLYAYWIPVDSSAVNYTDDETYKNSFTELTADPILNPLTYHWSHENTLMGYISTPLYGTDVNWDQAIEDGLVTAKGDFSSIDESNIGALLRENVKYGAAEYPIAVGGEFDGESGVDQNGKYSEAISREISAYSYVYTLRDDIYWEDGTNVTAQDYYYSYFQYIDQTQNNFRASSYYPNADRSSGLKVVGSRGYFLQGTEIGLGESAANPLTGDYGYAKLTTYAGPNPAAGYEAYAGDYLDELFGASLSRDLYISLDDFTASGYTLGDEGVSLTPELTALYGLGAHWLVDLDLRTDVVANPNYVGAKGDTWPAVEKSEVGFEVTGTYTFKMTFEVPLSHASAMNAGDFNLVHPATYAASLDENGTNSTYGTSQTPPLSYGPYVLKTWDVNQKMVFNKNYDSFMQQFFNYKAISFEFYPDVDSRMTAFAQGLLSSTGLNQTYYSTYLENPNLKSYYNGYP